MTFDDWYPSLQRAAHRNQWTDQDTLIQLTGHLRGRALQEWTLLRETEKGTLGEAAVTSLQSHLDPGSRALVALDFRHAAQRQGESVAEYISRLEQLFRRAHGREGMSDETRDTLLHCQLREGLRYKIMQAPGISGSHAYRELCLAARNEERRIGELAKRQHDRNPAPFQNLDSKTDQGQSEFQTRGLDHVTIVTADHKDPDLATLTLQIKDQHRTEVISPEDLGLRQDEAATPEGRPCNQDGVWSVMKWGM